MNDDDLHDKLDPETYHITQEKGTERAFTGKYWDFKEDGVYNCTVCKEPLFASDTKYDAGCGWPSFFAPSADNNVEEQPDNSHGMIRTEVVCKNCHAHLGHVFPDGPEESGLRYCINSASLNFEEQDKDKDQ